MSLRRLVAYGAVGSLLSLPSLALLMVTAVGLVLSVVLLGLPLLAGGLVLVGAVARVDRWLLTSLVGESVCAPDPLTWSRAGLVRVGRDAAFVLARSAVGLGAVTLCVAAGIACVAGVGAVAVNGFLATGDWHSTAGAGSWWGPLLAVAALAAGVAVLAVAGLLQTTFAGLLGPTESERLQRARHRQAATDGRARLAADLHDAVGHALSVTTLQAAAAARVVRTDPDYVEGALRQIEGDARRALSEVDRALALLTGAAATDAPDARQLPELLAALRTAGMTVLDEVAVPETLPAELSQAVYRVVQEAGTNALRHSPQGRLAVSVACDRQAVVVDVVDVVDVVSAAGQRNEARATLGPGGGRGLEGLRARCEALGGSFSAGASDGGNWIVSASLPLPGTRS